MTSVCSVSRYNGHQLQLEQRLLIGTFPVPVFFPKSVSYIQTLRKARCVTYGYLRLTFYTFSCVRHVVCAAFTKTGVTKSHFITLLYPRRASHLISV